MARVRRRSRPHPVADSRAIIPVNSSDRDFARHRYVLWFGAYGTTRLLVWADSLDDALDAAIDWLVENASGHIVDNDVNEEYERGIAEGLNEEEAQEAAEADTTIGGNAGNHILSYEWGILAEDPTREQMLELEGRPPETCRHTDCAADPALAEACARERRARRKKHR